MPRQMTLRRQVTTVWSPWPSGWKECLARSRQLKLGDIVVLDHDHKGSRPATLTWLADEAMIFVFVDHASLGSVALTRQELAMDMRRGQIRTAEGSTLSLTERALCGHLHRLHVTVKSKATSDALTGLVNRKHFEGEVKAAAHNASQSFDSVSLCLVDIDDFEKVRHACGRRPAKQLLHKLGQMLERLVGAAGLVCRIKGHRFAALITEGDEDDAAALFARFTRAVSEARCVFKGKPFRVTVSLGLITITPDIEDVTGAFTLAEQALETAIAGGGNKLHQHSIAVADCSGRDEPTVAELIRNNKFALRAQRVEPIDPQSSELLPYYEILLGVFYSTGALRPPGRVIDIAERRGEVFTLDRWVVQETINSMAADRAQLKTVTGYAINLSGLSLSEEGLLPYVMNLLTTLRVPPGKVFFEVTETAAIDKISVAQHFIHSLKEIGCKFSLDDFGVGHGSFAYLRNLPVDKIKIGGMFVKDLCENRNDRAVVKSINEIAHFMGRITVAEFVENDDILAVLRKLGVDYAQGYGIEKPMPIIELVWPGQPLEVASKAISA